MCEIESEKSRLKAKLAIVTEQAPKPALFDPSTLEFDVDGDLKVQCIRILAQTQFTPIQRVQLILSHFSAAITDLTIANESLQKDFEVVHSALESERISARQCKEVFNAFVTEIVPPGKPLPIHACSAPESPVIPQAFFSLSVDDKLTILHQFLEKDTPAAMFFIAQFVVNEQLRQKTPTPLQSAPTEVLKILQCESLAEIPKVFHALRNQIQCLQKEKQLLETKFGQLKNAFIQRNRRATDHISLIQRLRLQNHDLQNQVSVLELNIQTEKAVNVATAWDVRPETHHTDLTEQNRALQLDLEQSEKLTGKLMKKLAKAQDQQNEANDQFLSEIEALQQRLKDQNKRHRHKIQTLSAQFEERLSASTAQQLALQANIDRLKGQNDATSQQRITRIR
jgi:hypothetical protein